MAVGGAGAAASGAGAVAGKDENPAGAGGMGGASGAAPCGNSDPDCNFRLRCADASLAPRVFVNGQLGPYAVVADKTFLAWSDRDPTLPAQGRIRSHDTTGGAVTLELATDQTDPGPLAVDSEFVYWTTSSGDVTRASRIPTAPLPTIELLATGQRAPNGIAVDATYAYWLSRGGRSVLRTEKVSPRSAPTPLATTQEKPQLLVADTATLFWTTSSGFVESAPKAGGATSTLVSPDDLARLLASDTPLFEADGIALDETWVYFRARALRAAPAKNGTGQLLKVGKDGRGLTLLVDSRAGAISFLAAYDAKLYFSTGSSGGEVWRVDNDGAGLVLLSCQAEAYPRGIAVTNARVFWTNFLGATIAWAPR